MPLGDAWQRLPDAATAEVFAQPGQDADQVVMQGVARADGIAVDDGGQDAIVLLLGGLPDLRGDEVLFQPAEYRAGDTELPDVRNGGCQRGIAAGVGDGAV